jgi:hypothetical protein
MNGAKYREILDENQSGQDLKLRRRFTYQQDNNTKRTAKTMQKWLREQPESGRKPYRTSLDRPENSCAVTLSIQPDRA